MLSAVSWARAFVAWASDERGSVLLEHAVVVVAAATTVIVVLTIYAEPLYNAYVRVFYP